MTVLKRSPHPGHPFKPEDMRAWKYLTFGGSIIAAVVVAGHYGARMASSPTPSLMPTSTRKAEVISAVPRLVTITTTPQTGAPAVPPAATEPTPAAQHGQRRLQASVELARMVQSSPQAVTGGREAPKQMPAGTGSVTSFGAFHKEPETAAPGDSDSNTLSSGVVTWVRTETLTGQQRMTKRPITTAQSGAFTAGEEVPSGDTPEVLSEVTAGEPAKPSTKTSKAPTQEGRTVEIGELMSVEPENGKSALYQAYTKAATTDEKLDYLIMANASGDPKLARKIIEDALRPKQPKPLRLQALEYAHADKPESIQRYITDPDKDIAFEAQALLGLNPSYAPDPSK